jgi:uncharacterized protein YjbI with pentapeptide repeats
MSEITSKAQLLDAYKNGQRYFEDVELDMSEDLSDAVLSGAVFKFCWLNVNFVRVDLSGCQFVDCNLKTADLRYSNLTNASITGCTVESTSFSDSIVQGFIFSGNSVYGQDAGQEDFDSFHLFTYH